LNLSLAQGVEDKKIQTDFEGEWKYQTGNVGVKLGGTFNIERENKPSFSGTVALQKPQNFFWSVGGEYGEVEDSMGLSRADAKVSYITDSSEALFNVVYKAKSDKWKYTTNWFQRLSPQLNYGVNFSTSIGDKNGFETSAVVVGEYKVDENTTLRAKTTTQAAEIKVYPNLRIGFGLTQRITPGFTATLGADFNARHLFNTGPEGAPHSLGFEVNLS